MKKIADFLIKNRYLLFFVSCFFFVLSILYLYGSIYRYVVIKDGEPFLSRDARTTVVFNVYLVISLVTIAISLLSLVPYLVSFIKCEKKINVFFIGTIAFFVLMLIVSLIALRVAYV